MKSGGRAFRIGDDGETRWSWDVVTGAVAWSDGIDALFGLPPGGFGGTYEAYLALVHPDDRAHFVALIARTLDGEDEYAMSHRVLWPDGTLHWIDGRGELTRAPDGRPLRLDGIVWDASARRREAEEIRHLQRVQSVAGAVTKKLLRVQTEADAFAYACRIAVEEGRFRFAWVGLMRPDDARLQPAAYAGAELGYLAEARISVDSSRLGHGPTGIAFREGRPAVVDDVEIEPSFAPWRELARARGYRSSAALPLRRGGAVIGVLSIYAGEPRCFGAQEMELLEALADDIGFTLDALHTDERRAVAEQAMRRSEERFRALFEQAADAIFLADAAGAIVDVNPAACAMSGYRDGALRGLRLEEVLLPPPADAPPNAERRLRRQDGALLDVEVSATSLAHGGLQAYVRDLTPRKRVQQQLILADRLVSLGRLAAGVAHEVNNPLAYVLINLDRIARATRGGAASPSVVERVNSWAREAIDGAQRVRGVVRSLGTLGREDEETTCAVDLHRILDTSIRLADSRARHRGRIIKEYSAASPARGNDLRLGQVFVNLLLNAADALPEGRADENEIRVRTRDEEDAVVVEIADSGTGIAPDVIGRIFDPFFTTKPVGEGTGLGLAISHSIVSAFGGSIAVESRPGEGSTFRVRLQRERALPSAAEAAPAPTVPSPRPQGRARVLIVDDEPRLVRVLASLLEEHHDVTVATSGSDGIRECLAREYDCILCDLMMPDVSGRQLFAEVARARPGMESRIVFMTGGFASVSRAESSTSHPALEKPFTPDQLTQAIERVLAVRPTGGGAGGG